MSSPTVSAIVLLSFGGFALAFTGTFYRLGLAFTLWWCGAFRPLWPWYYDKTIELVENRSFGFWFIRIWGVLAVVIGGWILFTGGWRGRNRPMGDRRFRGIHPSPFVPN